MIVIVFNLLIFLVIFLIGSLGFVYGEILSFALSFLALFIYWGFRFVSRYSDFELPRISILLMAFLIFSSASVFFSVNRENSVYFFLQYVVLSGVFLFGFYREKLLQSFLEISLVVAGLILCLLSGIYNLGFLVGNSGYQLVFSRYGSHNHLGDFLVLPLLICTYNIFYKKRLYLSLILLIVFLSFFLLSYSRSAYLAFGVGCLFFLVKFVWKLRKKFTYTLKVGLISILLLVMLFFLATVFEARNYPVLGQVNYLLTDNLGLKFKSFTAKRFEYVKISFISIENNFWFGVGPGNFSSAASTYFSGIQSTDSSHNIFLDILVENGVFAFIFFLLLIFFAVKKAVENPSVYSLLLVALLVNFQTDYTFRISTMMLLFFLLMGLVYGRKSTDL